MLFKQWSAHTDTTNGFHRHAHLTVWLERTAQTHTDGLCFMRCQKKGFGEIKESERRLLPRSVRRWGPPWFHRFLTAGFHLMCWPLHRQLSPTRHAAIERLIGRWWTPAGCLPEYHNRDCWSNIEKSMIKLFIWLSSGPVRGREKLFYFDSGTNNHTFSEFSWHPIKHNYKSLFPSEYICHKPQSNLVYRCQ